MAVAWALHTNSLRLRSGSAVTNRAAMGRIPLLALASAHSPVLCAHLHGPGTGLGSKAKTAQVTSAT